MPRPKADKPKKAPTNPTPKKAITRLGEWKPVFLEQLGELGNVTRSAQLAGIDPTTAYEHRKTDPQFALGWRRALKRAGDVLEAEAWRRGVQGVSKPVYQSGKKVGAVQEYSDTLLIFLLKGVRPNKFRDNVRHEHTGAKGGPIRQHTTVDFTGFSDDELLKFERAATRGAGGTGTPSRN